MALGRAIVRDPKVFLFDEPLSNLDAKLRVQMRVELKKLHERLAVTTIYVTHDQVEAMTLGDRVVVMKDGVVQQVGEPLELYNTPANRFVAGFIGSPAMNFADVTLAEQRRQACAPRRRACGSACPTRWPPRARAKAGRKATLGIRPEDIHIAGAADPAGLLLRCRRRGGRAARLGDPARHPRRRRRLMVASVEPTLRVRAHDKLKLALNPDRLHLFDAETRSGDLIGRSAATCLGPTQALRARPTWPCAARRRGFLKSWP